MNKQSVIGFALIGIILLVFTWYNNDQFEKQQAQRARLDSIAKVEALKYAETMPQADTALLEETLSGESSQISLFRSPYLNAAYADTTEQICYLENEKIKVGITTSGAQPASVLIKDYFTYDSTALYLINESLRNSTFDVELDAGQYINTSDFTYRVVSSTPSNLVMRLYFAENSYIENIYTLATESNMVNLDMRFVGMNTVIPRSSSSFVINWGMNMPRFEKGYENEKNYSSLGFRYAENEDIEEISMRKDSGKETLAGETQWVAFKQQFFSAILVADDSFTSGEVSANIYPETNKDRFLMANAANLNVEYGDKSADFSKSFHFYFGPNHYPVLKEYDMKFDKLIPLGGWLVGSINKFVIIPIFNWLNRYIANYGLIILILTLMIKLVISPLTWKSYMSSAKMRVLRPEIEKINARYPKEADAMKRQQATMELYKKCDISMFGGCLPVLLQFPILYAMFRFFPASFELRQEGFLWADDLSGYDSILDFGFRIPLYGDHISLFALLMGITMFFYSKMTLNSMDTGQPQMAGMKFMQLYFMPIFMVILCNNFSAGLSYYYMLSNIVTIGQNFVIRKWFVDEKKIYETLQKKAASNATAKKSKFQQRLEEAYKIQQQQQQLQQKNGNRR